MTDVGTMYANAKALHELLQESRAENAKLRELCRDMFRDFANADYELRRNHGRTFMAVTRYERRMSELGVEVDG